MNARLTLKVIQQGQAQKTHAIAPGAGQNGKALVLQAGKGARYQLTDALTFASPEKLQIKREGQDLLIALQGNDVGTPDIVIKGYFDAEDVSLTGLSPSGEPMVYDSNTRLLDKVKANGPTPISGDSVQPGQALAVSLAKGPDGWFDSTWGLAAIGGGLAVVAAASGGSGGGSGSAAAAGIDKITAYKADQSKSLPTVTDFQNAGVSGVDSTNLTGILSLLPRTQLPLTTAASVQTLVDSFNKILAEANGSAADATPSSDPSATDYVNLMGSNTPGSLSRKAAALSFINDRLKALNTSEADGYSELKALADAVDALSLLAESSPSTSGTAATTGNLTAAQLTSLGVETAATNLGAVSDAVRQASDDLSTLNTVAKLTALVKAYNTILAEANGAVGDTTTANPTAADYAAIHANIGTAKTDAAALDRLNAIVGNLSSTSVDTVEEINKLAATLDKIQTVASLATGTTLTDAQKFSADELKALGLTGFTGTEIQNSALALKVSEIIRDKEVGDVQANATSGLKLTDNTLGTTAQTQLERLQELVSEQVIRSYSVDPATKTSPYLAPTAADWQNIGVYKLLADGSNTDNTTSPNTLVSAEKRKYQAISGADASALNDAIDTLVDNDSATTADDALVDTSAELRAIGASYLKILNEANGSASNVASDGSTQLNPDPDWNDYKTIGVKRQDGSTTENTTLTKLLNSLVGEKSQTQVDTIKELQTLVNLSEKVLSVTGSTSDSLTYEELTNATDGFGLTGITSGTTGNLSAINDAIRGVSDGDVDTFAELQSLVSLTRIQQYAGDTSKDAPTSSDWSFLKLSEAGDLLGEKSENLAAYNSAAVALGTTTINSTNVPQILADYQDLVTSYNKILSKANGSASDTITSASILEVDYANIGLDLPGLWSTSGPGGYTTYNDKTQAVSFLNDAIGRLNSSAVDSLAELEDLSEIVDQLFRLAKENNDGGPRVGTAPTNTNANTVGLTVENLASLGFDTSDISSDNEKLNVWAAIRDLDAPTLTYASIVSEIQRYAS